MPNPGQPTISSGAADEAVRRLQRALRGTPNVGLVVDDVFGRTTEAAVRDFQQGAMLVVDGVVGPLTWAALQKQRSAGVTLTSECSNTAKKHER